MHHLWAHSKDRYVKFCGHASDVRQQPSRQPVQCVMRATIQIDDKRQTTHPDDIINGLRIESTLLSRRLSTPGSIEFLMVYQGN